MRIHYWIIFLLILLGPHAVWAMEINDDVTASATWGLGDSPVQVNKADFTVAEGATLTIEAGVIVKVAGGFTVEGTLVVNGTAGSHVTFTELTVGAGWSQLKFQRETSSQDNRLAYADIEKLRYIYISEQKVSLNHCTISITGQNIWYGLAAYGGLYKPHGDIGLTIANSVFTMNSAYDGGGLGKVVGLNLDGVDTTIADSSFTVTATGYVAEVAGIYLDESNTGAYSTTISGSTVEVSAVDGRVGTVEAVYYKEATGTVQDNTVTVSGPGSIYGIRKERGSDLVSGNTVSVSTTGGSTYGYLYGIYYPVTAAACNDLIVDNQVTMSAQANDRYLYGIHVQTGKTRGNRITATHGGSSGALAGIVQIYYEGCLENNSVALAGTGGPAVHGINISTHYNASSVVTVKNNIISAAGAAGSYGIYKESEGLAAVLNTYNLIFGFANNYANLAAGLGEIYADPMFADGELHLSPGSPAIDAGDWSSPYADEPGLNGGRIDLGAFGNTVAANQSIPMVAPEITTNSGNDYLTADSAIDLRGYTSQATQTIKVNGTTTGVTYAAGDSAWSYSGDLAPGINAFAVSAVSTANDESAADTIRITRAESVLPPAPVLSLSTNGTNVTASWGAVTAASGYTLFYAPYPDASYIGRLEMGAATSLSVDLWPGAAFFVAIKAYNAMGTSEYSNVEFFQIPLGPGQ